MALTSERSAEPVTVVAVAIAVFLIGLASAMGLTVTILFGIIAIGSAAALVALPHLAVAVIVALTFTNAPMVIAESIGINMLTEGMLLLALTIGLIDYSKRRRLAPMVAYVALGGLIYVVSLAATALYAKAPEISIEETVVAAKRLLMVLAITAIVRDVKRFRWAIFGVAIGATFLGSLTLVQSVFGLQHVDFLGFAQVSKAEIAEQFDSWRYVGPVNDPNYYAQLLLLAVPLAVAGVLFSAEPWRKLLFLIGTAVIFTAMLLTVSRGAIVALLIVLVVALRSQARQLAIGALGLLAVGAIAVNFIPPIVLSRFVGVYHDISSVISGTGFIADKAIAGRLAEMDVAVRLFFDHPILGVGYNNYDSLYQDVARLNGLMSRGEAREAHSLYLEILSERGLIGAMFFAALVMLAIWSATIGARILSAGGHRLESALSLALVLSLTAYLATSVFLHEAFSYSFWVLISLAAAAPQATLFPAMKRVKHNGQGTAPSNLEGQLNLTRSTTKQPPKNRTGKVAPPKPTDTQPAPSPFDIFAALRRHVLVILVAAAVAGAFGAITARNAEPVFAASGSLIYRFQSEYMPGNIARSGYQGEAIRPFLEGAIQTEIEILGSREVVKGAVLRSGYRADEDMLSERLPAFLKALSIRRVEGTQLVRITFEDTNPDTAVRAISALLNSYLDRRATLFDTKPEVTLRDAAQISREELAVLRAEWTRIDARIATLSATEANDTGAPAAGSSPELLDLQTTQASLETEIELAEDHYRTVMKLLSEEELALKVEEAQGPAIKVLEPPEADPAPLGLSVPAQAVIAALIGLVAGAVLSIALDWRQQGRARRNLSRTNQRV